MTETERPTEQGWAEKSVLWAKTAPLTVSTSDAANQLLIELAGIGPGDTVLDLASGTCEPAISIALHVGESGSVVATDATPSMLDVARRRAERLGLKNIGFEVCPMEELSFEDASFDAVICRFGLMHANDALGGLKQALRVLKPGGKAACMVHGPSERNDRWTIVHTVVPAFFKIDSRKRIERHFRFSGAGELAELFQRAGFADIRDKEITTRVSKKAGEVFWSRMLNKGYGDRIATLDEALEADLNHTIAAAFRRCLNGDTYELVASQRVVVGTAPPVAGPRPGDPPRA